MSEEELTVRDAMTKPRPVKVYPPIPNVGSGNIVWRGRYTMRFGRFPDAHPVGGTYTRDGQYGTGEAIEKFRARGYWASCFPEGDGICWDPQQGQSIETTMADIRECFAWDPVLGRKP